MGDASSANYNPFLIDSADRALSREGGKGRIEPPRGKAYNMPWQTRPRAPTPYEQKLSQTLEAIFLNGAAELADIVAGLNKSDVSPENHSEWTEAVFVETIARLSMLPGDPNEDSSRSKSGAGIVPRN